MLQLTSYLKVCDRTGIVTGQCIKVLGPRKKLIGKLGDMILVTVKRVNVRRLSFVKVRLQKRFQRGTLHRVLILRTQVNYQRQSYAYIRFNENAAIVVNRRRIPISNRMYGPLIREFSLRWPWLGCVSRCNV